MKQNPRGGQNLNLIPKKWFPVATRLQCSKDVVLFSCACRQRPSFCTLCQSEALLNGEVHVKNTKKKPHQPSCLAYVFTFILKVLALDRLSFSLSICGNKAHIVCST